MFYPLFDVVQRERHVNGMGDYCGYKAPGCAHFVHDAPTQ